MGNQGPPDAARNTVNVVEEAYLYAIDPNTGERTTIETDDGLLKAVVESDAGNRLTDTLESESVDEQRIRLYAEDDNGDLNEIQAESLSTGVADDTYAQITYLARALDSKSLDEFVSRVTDSNGTQIDPLTQDATEAVGNTELRTRVLGPDAAGTLQQANVEAFDTGLAATDIGLATYTARSLEGVGQDHVQASLYADDPNNVLSRLNVNNNGELLTDASLDAATVFIDADDDDGNTLNPNAETLSEAITDPDGLVTYLARALTGHGHDQLRTDIENNNAGLATESSLTSEQAREIATWTAGTLAVEQQSPVGLEGTDDDGNTLGVDVETVGHAINDADGLLTYLARALQTQSFDQLRVDLQNNNAGTLPVEPQSPVAVEDSGGTQVDPAVATEYLDHQTAGHDLAGGDLVIGAGTVERGTAVTIAATSTDNNAFSVSVEWVDGSGNTYQSESAADIGLDSITEDYARLVRKAPAVEITVTDTSGAAQNRVNVHADTER
jgi:hypothetical protein